MLLMKIGVQINKFKWKGSPDNIGGKLSEIAIALEENNFDSLWVMDHFFQLSPLLGRSSDPMMEAYTTLGYIAGVTKKIKLGVLVAGVIYREPAFLIKQISALDVLSGGRTYFGIGAAWYEREALGLGFNYPPLKERFERLEEALQITKQMWSGDTDPYNGKYYKLQEPVNSPQPITKPHPPILIGGGGEKKTLRFVAKYGDACNVFGFSGVGHVKHKFEVLRKHCEDLGRDYNEIEKTVLLSSNFIGSPNPKKIIDRCQSFAEVGVDHIIYPIPKMDTIKPLETFGKKIIPEVSKL